MKNFNITISREFGCNAREITRMLASKLKVTMYDNDLVDLAADKAQINHDSFTDIDKLMFSSEEKLTKFFGYGSTSNFYSEKAIQAQIDVIKEIADKKQPAIFLGRCADYILREYPNTLNIFLYSPLERRIEHMVKTYNLTERSAEKMIKRIDRQRHNFYKYVTGVNRSDRSLKHIMIDVDKFGFEKTVDIIYQIAKMEFED